MASSLPGSGPLSAGTKAGADRSINLLKNDVITPAAFNSRLSLKEVSDTLASAKGQSLSVPQMVVGPPYKYSELYGVGKTQYKQVIQWSVTADGSDFYKWSTGLGGVLASPSQLWQVVQMVIVHSSGEWLTGTVTNVYNWFGRSNNKPSNIQVNLDGFSCITYINGIEYLNTGNGLRQSRWVFINISPENNGSFTYQTGNKVITVIENGNTIRRAWVGGSMSINTLEQVYVQNRLWHVTHNASEWLTGTVTNVYNWFKNKPTSIYVKLTGRSCITFINDIEYLNLGRNITESRDIFIVISPKNNGSFTYKTGNNNPIALGRGEWAGGMTHIEVYNKQPQEIGTLSVTHRNGQPPSGASIISKLFLNNTLINTSTLTGQGKVGTTILPFNILQATKARVEYSGRGRVALTEQPTAANDYSTTVLVDDDGVGAQGAYTVYLFLEA